MTVRALLLFHQDPRAASGTEAGERAQRQNVQPGATPGWKEKLKSSYTAGLPRAIESRITGQGGCAEEGRGHPLASGKEFLPGEWPRCSRSPGLEFSGCGEVPIPGGWGRVLRLPGSVQGEPPVVFTHPGGLFRFAQEEPIPAPEEQN